MEQKITVHDRITDCAKTIFTFSLSRTGNRQKAEDLSQEIIFVALVSITDTLT